MSVLGHLVPAGPDFVQLSVQFHEVVIIALNLLFQLFRQRMASVAARQAAPPGNLLMEFEVLRLGGGDLGLNLLLSLFQVVLENASNGGLLPRRKLCPER